MIKSKALKKYYGRKAYADGYYGRIREHAVIENADGMKDVYVLDTGYRNLISKYVVIIEKLHFLTRNNVIVCIAVVDGRTYVGNAVFNPKDEDNDITLGRRLALARALQDTDGIQRIAEEVSEMNSSDGVEDDEVELDDSDGDEDEYEDDDSDGDEDDLVTYCDYCNEPIYKNDNYYKTPDGYYACCDECFEKLQNNEFWEYEEDDSDGESETKEHYI